MQMRLFFSKIQKNSEVELLQQQIGKPRGNKLVEYSNLNADGWLKYISNIIYVTADPHKIEIVHIKK